MTQQYNRRSGHANLSKFLKENASVKLDVYLSILLDKPADWQPPPDLMVYLSSQYIKAIVTLDCLQSIVNLHFHRDWQHDKQWHNHHSHFEELRGRANDRE